LHSPTNTHALHFSSLCRYVSYEPRAMFCLLLYSRIKFVCEIGKHESRKYMRSRNRKVHGTRISSIEIECIQANKRKNCQVLNVEKHRLDSARLEHRSDQLNEKRQQLR